MFVWYPTGVLKQQHAAESKIHTSASKLTYEGTLSIHHQFVNFAKIIKIQNSGNSLSAAKQT